MKLSRTTMVPQVYHETTDINQYKDKSASFIKEHNDKINQAIKEKTKDGSILKFEDIEEIEYFVPRIPNFVDLLPNVFLSIYDIPGLNDNTNDEAYFKYVTSNFYKFDIIVFVVDINSGLNTSAEIQILETITKLIKDNKIKYDMDKRLVILANKCDDLLLDENSECQMNTEQQENLDQMIQIIKNRIKKIHPECKYDIIPISAEDSYMYRMIGSGSVNQLDMKYVNKIGINEYGRKNWNKKSDTERRKLISDLIDNKELDITDRLKTVGFDNLSNVLKHIIESNNKLTQYEWLLDKIKYDVDTLKNSNSRLDISEDLINFTKNYNKIPQLKKEYEFLHKKDLEIVTNKLVEYVDLYNKIVEQYLNSCQIDNLNIIIVFIKKIIYIFEQIGISCSIYYRTIELKKQIQFVLIKHIVDSTKLSRLSSKECITIIDKLYRNESQDLYNQIKTIILDSTHFLYEQKEELIKIIHYVKSNKYLSEYQIINISCHALLQRYAHIWINHQNCLPLETWYELDLFWNNLIIPVKNPFYVILTQLKLYFETHVKQCVTVDKINYFNRYYTTDHYLIFETTIVSLINELCKEKIISNYESIKVNIDIHNIEKLEFQNKTYYALRNEYDLLLQNKEITKAYDIKSVKIPETNDLIKKYIDENFESN